MKTGRDANRAGLYISECCLSEVAFTKEQMFTRCPACNALTVWEFVKSMPRLHDSHFERDSQVRSTTAHNSN
jgi:hypothetical protein